MAAAPVLIHRGDAETKGVVWAVDGGWLTADDDLAGILAVRAGKDFNQGRFASAIVADQRHDFARPHVNISIAQGLHVAE